MAAPSNDFSMTLHQSSIYFNYKLRILQPVDVTFRFQSKCATRRPKKIISKLHPADTTIPISISSLKSNLNSSAQNIRQNFLIITLIFATIKKFSQDQFHKKNFFLIKNVHIRKSCSNQEENLLGITYQLFKQSYFA